MIKREVDRTRFRRMRHVLVCAVYAAGVAMLSPHAFAQSETERADEPPKVRANPRAAPAQPDPIQDILKNIDPELLNFSGAELDVEVVGDQLILRGNQADIDVVELLVTILQQTRQQKVLRVITITEKDANDIASRAGDALRDILRQPNQRPEDEVSVTALSSTILLVAALPDEIDFVVDVIQQVDAVKEQLPPLEQLVFPIKHRKATDVAKQLTEIIEKMQAKKGASGAKSEIQVIPNNANNSIMVLAPEKERGKIERLLAEIDVEPVKGWGEVKLTFYPLLHSKASEMADVVTELIASQKDREAAEEVIYRLQISKALPSGEILELPPIDLQKPTRIIADPGTNSLMVATVEENVGPIGELIRLLDGVPMAEEVALRLFPLRFADAETIGELLKEMVSGGGELTQDPDGSGADAVPEGALGKALVYNVGIFPDVRTNTLIVTGREEHLQLAAQLVDELDRPATALKFPLRFIELVHTDATKVGDVITQLFDQRFQAAEKIEAGRAALERERIFLSVDIRSNSLIVSASEENYAEILLIAQQLDTKPAKLFDQIRIIRCERLSAKDLKEKIDELWQRKAELRREEDLLLDLPIVVVDQRSNSLVIASRLEDFEEIERLIERLEAQPLIDDTKLFKLEYADAAVLASMLKELFEGIAAEVESFKAPTILPDPRSNALVVAGSKDAIERVEELIERLDVESGPLTAIFTVYPLEHTSATQLAPRMEELFKSRSEGQDVTRTPIVILPDETSNSLICSASRDDHEIIVELLGLLDKPSNLARQFEIFPLQKAKASKVVESLESLFKSQGDGGSGRADAIATQADDRTNSIIVWASPSQMANIGEVIARLDTSKPAVEVMVKVIQLKQALAQDFAELLRNSILEGAGGGDEDSAIILSFMEKQEDGSELVRKLFRQDIHIEADPRTNSLMVMAPVDSINMLEAMIRDFDAIRPIRSELRLFPLINADAESMVEQLGEIFEPDNASGDAQNQLVFGDTIGDFDIASVGQDLRFAADSRTNTLIAAGAEVDLRMVEQLVQYLDAQRADDRVVEVIQTKYVEPSEIASAIQGFNQQEQDVLGDLGNEEAQVRRMERQISVESVGSEEGGSSSLIVGTSRRMYADTMAMIQQLDRPEPQVMISVLIAEVTLTDSLDFGLEIAGQALDFSLGAVQGPNGIVRGSDFDFVGGSNFGVGGGLGFNFSVTGEDFSFLLHALQQESRLEVLSRPVLLVRNGEEGKITIADQVPFVQSSQINDTGSTNSVVGREDVGIVLTATPHISPDGYVTIALTQEISSFSGENLQLTEGVSSPIFSTRELDTNVTVRDGETVVIGGLITSRVSEGSTKIPILGDLLGDIPVLGGLFKTTNISEQKTELLIVMTVDVLRTDEDTHRMSVEQRDKFMLPDSIRQSTLMEGLRILPDEDLLGPAERGASPGQRPLSPDAPREERKLYGPKPKSYGPTIERPKTITKAQRRTYGPWIARGD